MASISFPIGNCPQLTEKQLKNTLKYNKYLHSGAASRQIVCSLDSLAYLKACMQEYTFKDGKKMELLLLTAAIPVNKLDTQHDVPLHIWVPRGFPKEGPLVYISLRPEMGMSSVSYVDAEGRINLPYLAAWKETRSDLSTMAKMLSCKFSQQCPVYLMRVRTNSCTHSSCSTSKGISSFRMSDYTMMSPCSSYCSLTQHELEMAQMRSDLEKKEREVFSYTKTVEALTKELDELGSRVIELELVKQEVSLRGLKGGQGKVRDDSAALREVKRELKDLKKMNANYKELLEEQTEKLKHELVEKKKIQSRLNYKISDLTQSREKVAIFEVDIEDCYQDLQLLLTELKHSRIEAKEIVGVNQELRSQISILAQELNSVHEELKERESIYLAEDLRQKDAPTDAKESLLDTIIPNNSSKEVEQDFHFKALDEIESLEAVHASEKQEMIQHMTSVVDDMKEKSTAYETEIYELKRKVNSTQKEMEHVKLSLMDNGETNTVSFTEVHICSSHKLWEGRWGHLVQGNFRGKPLGVRVISKESISRFSVDLVFKQIRRLASLRHPNILLFVAAVLDAPQGMFILTELCHHTLKQVYEEPAMYDIDRLPAMLDVAVALNFLHLQSTPIIHNNLSSSCVVVEETASQTWRAKLSDIGSAVPLMVLSEADDRLLLRTPPEKDAYKTGSNCLPSTDIYSYGLLLSEAALNILPDDACEMKSKLISCMKERLPAVLCLTEDCLSPVPAERPTMGNVVAKLQNLVANKIKLTAMD